eukprot:TRINITY_DN680_c1_g1_i1.p1 TRINITY_DN680_c1_g1~~TRINITY_DN680_c1_g1_i1.p1  ORF type:complete len:950 (-),score=407.06 TRINITY_DN680_c1_g1_i1:787-3636(-)
MSLVDEDGEWKFRKINIFGVLKSFISQLKPGQDLTRVSLPAVLLHPYSLLEVMGSRELTTFDVLVDLNRQKDPLERFLNVLRWLFSCIQQETFHKKPFNPVLGETHHCSIESEDFGRTEFIGEQVSHHPPVSAFCVRNRQEEVSLTSNISFSVKFATNSVSVVTAGAALIRAEQLDEEYEMTKCLPDMKIARIVWGVKKIFWTGEISISCPKTGYSATVIFEEQGNENGVKGFVSRFNGFADETLFHIEGKCSHSIHIVPADGRGQKKLLIDVATVRRPQVIYPSRLDQPPLSSMNVWADVARYIVDDDMSKADEAKKIVENAQRERIAERKATGAEYAPTYFTRSESIGWAFKAPKEDKKSGASAAGSKRTTPIRIDDKKQASISNRHSSSPSGSGMGSARRKLQVSSSEEDDTDTDSDSSDVALPEKAPKPRDRELSSSPSMSGLRDSMKREERKDPPAPVSEARVKEGRAQRDDKREERDEERRSNEMQARDPHRFAQSTQHLQLPAGAMLQHSASMESKEEPRDKRSGSASRSRRSMNSSSAAPLTLSVPNSAAKRENSRSEFDHRASMPPPASPMHPPAVPVPQPANYVREEMLDKDERKKLRAETKKALGSPLDKQMIDEVNFKSGWMKMRNSMRLWVNKYFVLRPGMLVYYDNYKNKYLKNNRCAGILRLSDCKVKLRKSGKSGKDGFQLKIYHLLHYPIYHRKGLQGETLKLAMIPVSWNYCLLKCASEEDRTEWMNLINQQIAYANFTESPTRRLQLPIGTNMAGAGPLLSSASESEDADDDAEDHKEEEHEDDHEKAPKVAGLHDMDLKSEDEEHEDDAHAAIRLKKPLGAEIAEDLFQAQDSSAVPPHEQEHLLKEMADDQRAIMKSYHKKTVKALEESRRTLENRMLATERKLLALTSRATASPAPSSSKLSMPQWKFALILLAVFLFARWLYNAPA